MLMASGLWPGTVPEQLQSAWDAFLGFCRRRREHPTMTAFSRRLNAPAYSFLRPVLWLVGWRLVGWSADDC